MIRGRQQTRFGRDAAKNEMGMFGIGRQELPGCLDGRVNRLNGDLRRGEIAADKDVEVRDLGKGWTHRISPLFHRMRSGELVQG
jgi:hypothetical protein